MNKYMSLQDQVRGQLQVANCFPSVSWSQGSYPTPAIAIDRAENGWIVTKGGYTKAVARTYDEMLELIKAHFEPKAP